MTSLPSPQSRSDSTASSRPSYRNILLTSTGLGVAMFCAYFFQRYVHGPSWLVMLIAFAPLVLLVPLVLCLFSLIKYHVVTEIGGPTQEAASFRRGDILRQALRDGSPAWSFGFILASLFANDVVQLAGMPQWVRGLLSLTPLLPLAMYLRSVNRDGREIDELAQRVRYEAYRFAFYGMLGAIVTFSLLTKAGVMPEFKWSPSQLILSLVALFSIGAVISSRRYR